VWWVTGGEWWVCGGAKFSPFVDRLLLWRQTVCQSKLTSQIAMCFILKSFENPKSFYSFFRILKFDFRREIGKTEFWCLTGLPNSKG
jgi:hypothetical protein